MWSLVASIVFGALDMWMKRQKMNDKMRKSYVAFLKQVDKKGMAKVGNYIAAEHARETGMAKIKAERLKREAESK